jgi:rhamnosyl/mannosyltransferase
VKVLQIGKFFPPARGGIETVLRFVVEGLANSKKYENEVLVFNEKPVTETDVYFGTPVTRLARWEQLFSVPFSPSMYMWLRSRVYDIVHIHIPNPVAAICFMATGPSKKLVLSYHSDIIKQRLLLKLYAPIQRRLLDRADRIIVSSQTFIDNSPVLSKYEEKCRIVPYGIDPEPFLSPSESDLAEREKVRAEYPPDFILFAGRLVYYKGLQFLLQAMKNIDCHLVIAGDGPFFANLKLLATGLKDRVTFTGPVSDKRMRALMASCRFFVFPSISPAETFGLVQLEAMAAGKAVINTSLKTSVPEVSIHGETGITVPPSDVPALSDALNKLVKDDSLCSSYGEAAKRRFLDKFTVSRMAEGISSVYDELF